MTQQNEALIWQTVLMVKPFMIDQNSRLCECLVTSYWSHKPQELSLEKKEWSAALTGTGTLNFNLKSCASNFLFVCCKYPESKLRRNWRYNILLDERHKSVRGPSLQTCQLLIIRQPWLCILIPDQRKISNYYILTGKL